MPVAHQCVSSWRTSFLSRIYPPIPLAFECVAPLPPSMMVFLNRLSCKINGFLFTPAMMVSFRNLNRDQATFSKQMTKHNIEFCKTPSWRLLCTACGQSRPVHWMTFDFHQMPSGFVGATYENIWKDMHIFENIWTHLKIYEHIWKYMKLYENIWKHMKTYENISQIWKHMKT